MYSDGAVVIEYGAAQCPTSTTVAGGIATATGPAAFPRGIPKDGNPRGSAASSKAAIPAVHPSLRVRTGTTTSTDMIGSSRTGLALRVASLNAIEPAILNAISEESTS